MYSPGSHGNKLLSRRRRTICRRDSASRRFRHDDREQRAPVVHGRHHNVPFEIQSSDSECISLPPASQSQLCCASSFRDNQRTDLIDGERSKRRHSSPLAIRTGARQIYGSNDWNRDDSHVIMSPMPDITRILNLINEGDATAPDQLLPLVYDELRRLAAAKMAREATGQTLQATALVHEAYLRLAGSSAGKSYHDRRHFFAAAATAMRRILVDRARGKKSLKRGGDLRKVPLQDVADELPDVELLALHDALDKLRREDSLKADLVELRYFVGLTGDQAAEVLGISPSSVDRHWSFARAWLQHEVRGDAN